MMIVESPQSTLPKYLNTYMLIRDAGVATVMFCNVLVLHTCIYEYVMFVICGIYVQCCNYLLRAQTLERLLELALHEGMNRNRP